MFQDESNLFWISGSRVLIDSRALKHLQTNSSNLSMWKIKAVIFTVTHLQRYWFPYYPARNTVTEPLADLKLIYKGANNKKN